MARIFVFGDSHTRALKNALSDYDLPNPSLRFDIHWMLSEKDGTTRGDLKYQDALNMVSELTKNDLLVISLLGTGHNIFGLVEHEIPFYISNNDQNDIALNNKCIIPVTLMEDMFVTFCKKNRIIPELKKATQAKVIHLMTPPPKGDNDYIKSKISRYRDKVIGKYEINDPKIRLNLWRIEMKAMNEICGELSILLLSPPNQAITPSGFLKEDYYAGDATHANHHYGKLVIDQLVNLLETANDQGDMT